MLIDWKTSKRPQRPEWLTDYWLQVTAYAHAYHWLYPQRPTIQWLALGIDLKGYTRELYFTPWSQAQSVYLPQWLARLEAYQNSTAA